VIPVFALPLPGGRYRLIYEEAVEPPAGPDAASIQEFTERCTAAFERYVRQYPALWLWMHRRWRAAETRATMETSLVRSSAEHLGADS
jgi:KDO2-lipid IV(A) lauroyltransferase